jgi:hypothetical protein
VQHIGPVIDFSVVPADTVNLTVAVSGGWGFGVVATGSANVNGGR